MYHILYIPGTTFYVLCSASSRRSASCDLRQLATLNLLVGLILMLLKKK